MVIKSISAEYYNTFIYVTGHTRTGLSEQITIG